MLSVAIGGLAFIAVTLTITVLGRHLNSRPSRELRQAAWRLRALGDPISEESDSREAAGWLVGVGARLVGWLAPRNGERVANLQSRLALAGYRDASAVMYFTVAQLVLVVGLTLAFGGLVVAWGMPWKKVLLWVVAGGGAGLIAPGMLLTHLINKRQRRLRNALPDALDIMVLSIEGGASLNAAINWAADEIQTVHQLLGAELIIVQHEIHLGLSAGEAFLAFGERCGLAEARDLATALLQSEKYGASVGKALRAFADTARQDRQLWAEETAQKAAVKIIFPMLLCIFPAIFIVLLGPAALQMSKLFAR